MTQGPLHPSPHLKELHTFLKSAGFFDKAGYEDIASSPMVCAQITAKYGTGWKSQAYAYDAALTLEEAPPLAGITPSAPISLAVAAEPPPSDLVAVLPPPSMMQWVKSGKFLGGAGKKEIYQDEQGSLYLVKKAYEKDGSLKAKPFAAYAQEVFSAVARVIRPDHVPVCVHRDGSDFVTVQPFFSEAESLAKVTPGSFSEQDIHDIVTEHVLDWLMSQHDSSPENIIRRSDGRLVGIDKEQAFRFFPLDALSVSYSPNPITPFYNTFWPLLRGDKATPPPTGVIKVVEDVLALVHGFPESSYTTLLRRYSALAWPTEASKRENFEKRALLRKTNIHVDFCDFLNSLGFFKGGTFAFLGTETVASPKKLKKVVAVDLAAGLGFKQYEYFPIDGPDAGKKDPSKVVLKISKTESGKVSVAKMVSFLPPESQIDGSVYKILVYNKNLLYQTQLEIEEEVSAAFEVDVEDLAAHVVLDPSKEVVLNNDILDVIETTKLGVLGVRVSAGADLVEGQCLRVRRIQDDEGLYYQVQFKLRRHAASLVKDPPSDSSSFSSADFTYPALTYRSSDDVLEEKDTGVYTIPDCKVFTVGSSELFFCSDLSRYSFHNSVVAKVRLSTGGILREILGSLLDAMHPSFSSKILRNPTEDEQERAKLARLLWVMSPFDADNGIADKKSVPELRDLLQGLGLEPDMLGLVCQRETYPGHQSYVLPGRSKLLAQGNFRFLFQGVASVEAALSVLKIGLLGISERAAAGIPLQGSSIQEDIKTGAADQVLTRPVTTSGLSTNLTSHFAAGVYQAIVTPEEIDRLDCYMHPIDHFGSCNPNHHSHGSAWTKRSTIEEGLRAQQKSYRPGAEVMFRKGIDKSRIIRIVCSSLEHRLALISLAKKEGIVEMNGISIESFVGLAKSCNDVWTKYVQPYLEKTSS